MNKRNRKACAALGMVLTVLSVNALPCQAVNYQMPGNLEMGTEIQAVQRAADVEWKYQYIDGVRYKRLWDNDNNKWLTDWIPCA